MRKLLAAALVASLVGLAAADEKGAAPAAPAAAPAKGADKAAAPKKKSEKGAAAAKPVAEKPTPVQADGKPAEKPCEPVKPCPID
jgi:hypothetical protein